VVTVLNSVGNYVLAFGKLGFPAMGIVGLAVASIAAHWFMFLSLLSYMLWHQPLRQYSLFQALHRLEPKILQQLLGLGTPIGLAAISEYGLFTVVTFFAGALGTPILAAHQVVTQTIMVVFMVPIAMSYAATARVGQWFGQRDGAQVQQAAWVSLGLAMAFTGVMAVALLTHLRQVVGLYLDLSDPVNAPVVAAAVSILTVAALGQGIDAVLRTTNGILQGLQDTRIPMLLGTAAYWGIGLPTSYLLGFHTPLSGAGVWLGYYAGTAVAAIAFLWRFRTVLQAKQLTQHR
jgi:multidrug resistance protein, MATE family